MRAFICSRDDVVTRLEWEDGSAEARPVLEGVPVRCVAADGDRVIIGTQGAGALLSSDGGRRWGRMELPEPDVFSVAIGPADGALYAGTEPSRLFVLRDGAKWTELEALQDIPSRDRWSFPPRPWTHHVRTIALHPSDPGWLAVGIELGGVMRSLDGGASWIDHNPQAHSDAHQLLTHPLAPDRLYEAAGQGIARSEDRGETWSRFESGLDRHYAWAQAIDPADPDLWYVAISRSPFAAHGEGDGQARLLRSRGNAWEAIDTWGDGPALRRMPYALATLPAQPEHLLVGLRGGSLLLTADAGQSWSRLRVELPDLIDLAVAA